VVKDFERLTQLILIEEFKVCVPPSIKKYIDVQKASTLHQAAVLADDYSLTHRNAFAPADSSGSAGSRDDKSATSPSSNNTPFDKHRNRHDIARI